MSESVNEILWVNELHPDCPTYASVYEKYNLLNNKTYMAHCCHSSIEEMSILAQTGCSAVHCASSNFMLSSGVMDVRMFLNNNIKVAIGTDVAGGYSPSMLDALRQTIIASRVKSFHHLNVVSQQTETETETETSNVSTKSTKSITSIDSNISISSIDYESLNYSEAFHLATVGGAEVLGMGKVLGNFEINKKLDCLIIDLECYDTPIDLFGTETLLQKFEKYLFLADDRNIMNVYVDGKKVI